MEDADGLSAKVPCGDQVCLRMPGPGVVPGAIVSVNTPVSIVIVASARSQRQPDSTSAFNRDHFRRRTTVGGPLPGPKAIRGWVIYPW